MIFETHLVANDFDPNVNFCREIPLGVLREIDPLFHSLPPGQTPSFRPPDPPNTMVPLDDVMTAGDNPLTNPPPEVLMEPVVWLCL